MANKEVHWQGSFGHRLGMKYLQVAAGRAEAELVVEDGHCNPNGVCHGGALFTLADDSMGAAAHGLAPEGLVPASLEVSSYFARSARPGERLQASTRVLSSGRRTAVLETRVEDAEQRLVALFTSSYMFVERRASGG